MVMKSYVSLNESIVGLMKDEGPYVVTQQRTIDEIIQRCKLKYDSIIVDLGCGDANPLIQLSSSTGAKCIGCEIDPVLCATARRNVSRAQLEDRITILNQDIMSFCSATNFELVSLIYIFLTPNCLKALSPIFRSRCPPGIWICSYMFPFDNTEWVPIEVVDTCDSLRSDSSTSKLYFYYT
jgi:ubiquinone/menaquinone biosynthesis C-methylase UbiE